jgi:hypothetical protein
MLATSAGEWVHCGRVFSATEIAELCATVAWLPGLARKELAATVCEHLGWTTLTGTAKISACLDFLERFAGGRVAGPTCVEALAAAPLRATLGIRRPRCRAGGALRPVGARAGVPESGSRRDPGGAVGCAGGALAPAGFPGGLRLPAALLHQGGRAAAGLRPAVRCCPRGSRARPAGSAGRPRPAARTWRGW